MVAVRRGPFQVAVLLSVSADLAGAVAASNSVRTSACGLRIKRPDFIILKQGAAGWLFPLRVLYALGVFIHISDY